MNRIQALGILYVVIALLTNLQGGIKDTMSQHDWMVLGISSFLAGAIALRAFLDRTSGEQSASDKMAASGQSAAGLPSPTPPLAQVPLTELPSPQVKPEPQETKL